MINLYKLFPFAIIEERLNGMDWVMEKVTFVPLSYRLADVQDFINCKTDELCIGLQTSDHDFHRELFLEEINLRLYVVGDTVLFEPAIDPSFVSVQNAEGVIEVAFPITERSLGSDAFRIVRHYTKPVDFVGLSRLRFTTSDKTEHIYDFTRTGSSSNLAWVEI